MVVLTKRNKSPDQPTPAGRPWRFASELSSAGGATQIRMRPWATRERFSSSRRRRSGPKLTCSGCTKRTSSHMSCAMSMRKSLRRRCALRRSSRSAPNLVSLPRLVRTPPATRRKERDSVVVASLLHAIGRHISRRCIGLHIRALLVHKLDASVLAVQQRDELMYVRLLFRGSLPDEIHYGRRVRVIAHILLPLSKRARTRRPYRRRQVLPPFVQNDFERVGWCGGICLRRSKIWKQLFEILVRPRNV